MACPKCDNSRILPTEHSVWQFESWDQVHIDCNISFCPFCGHELGCAGILDELSQAIAENMDIITGIDVSVSVIKEDDE